MSGIVGYIGQRQAVPLLLEALHRLEYRGYDSAGMARIQNGAVLLTKSQGRVSALAEKLAGLATTETLGIAHTRWATHGAPTETNAHPHTDCTGKIAIVHNGIIDNYPLLKKKLIEEGHVFRSDTDSEVLAHLIEKTYRENLGEAVRQALLQVHGSYAIAVVAADQPNVIVVARAGSPLMIGVGQGEYFVASDLAAIVPFTNQVVTLGDGELARISREQFQTMTLTNIGVQRPVEQTTVGPEKYERGNHAHFVLKEMLEEPEVVRRAAFGRVIFDEGMARFGGINITHSELRAIRRLIVAGSGSAYHAALYAQCVFEDWAGLAVVARPSSELRYRNMLAEPDILGIAVSASGETADTLAAVRELKRKGLRVIGISNVAGSAIARETDGGISINAGPEVGVPSTKTLIGQVTVLCLLAILMGRLRGMSVAKGRSILDHLGQVPMYIEDMQAHRGRFASAVALLKDAHYVLVHGRKGHYAVACEAAQKIVECAQIPVWPLPGGESKHAALALLAPGVVSLFFAPTDTLIDAARANILEVKARGGKTIVVGTAGDGETAQLADVFIGLPDAHEMVQPILSFAAAHILAYELGVALGKDVDRPPHLAKSVSV